MLRSLAATAVCALPFAVGAQGYVCNGGAAGTYGARDLNVNSLGVYSGISSLTPNGSEQSTTEVHSGYKWAQAFRPSDRVAIYSAIAERHWQTTGETYEPGI